MSGTKKTKLKNIIREVLLKESRYNIEFDVKIFAYLDEEAIGRI